MLCSLHLLHSLAAFTDSLSHGLHLKLAWNSASSHLVVSATLVIGIWHAGITIIYTEQAAASPAPAPAPAGPPAASVLALPMNAVMNGPFVLNAGAPVASGFQAPSYLQGFRFSELPADSLLPTVSCSSLRHVPFRSFNVV